MATAPAGGRSDPGRFAFVVATCPVRLPVRSAVFQAAKVGFDSRTGYFVQVGIASGNALGFQNRRLNLRGSIPPLPADGDCVRACERAA